MITTPPMFCRTVAIVSNDAVLTAIACSIVGDAGQYIAVLRAPRTWDPAWDFDMPRHSNALARTRAERILLIGLDARSIAHFGDRFGKTKILVADTLEEVLGTTKSIASSTLSGTTRCTPQEIGRGLLLAKRRGHLLSVADGAVALTTPGSTSNEATHLVAVDDAEGVAPVIAANYAYSLDADLRLLPKRTHDISRAAYRRIDERFVRAEEQCRKNADRGLDAIADEVAPSLNLGKREFVTFITREFPYGYFYSDAPCTHLFSRAAGTTIVSSVYWAREKRGATSALLLDPGHFDNSETTEIADTLRTKGLFVAELRDQMATVNTARLAVSNFPYDLLYICSHSVDLSGERLTVRMTSQDAEEHELVFDLLLNVASNVKVVDGEEKVLVNELFLPVSLDSLEWGSVASELKKDAWEYILRHKDHDWETVHREPVGRIAHSLSLPLNDGDLLLNTIDHVDAATVPIVFNNSCVSFFDAAVAFTAAGARAYIGTLTPVADSDAKAVAVAVFHHTSATSSIALAIDDVQRRRWSDPRDRIYVHVGCHFDNLAVANGDNLRRQRERVAESRRRWEQYATQADGYQKELALESAGFLARIMSQAE